MASKLAKKWTLENVFPHFMVFSTKSYLVIHDFAIHGFFFPPNTRELRGLPVLIKLLSADPLEPSGGKKVCRKKSYSYFSVFPYVSRGETSSSKCPRPAQVDFHSYFKVVGSNPGREFQKIAFQSRISSYFYIQPLGHKKQCYEGLCKSF